MEGSNPRGPGHIAQVVALMMLAPVCAEYLAAYDESTGDPAELLWGLLILSPLYGASALIIREIARRASLGWPGLILMASAFGVLQAGVVDQSLFSIDYRGIGGWEEGRRGTLIEPLGISAHMAQLFIVGHVIYSICAPIALIEALRPNRQHQPWLGNVGLAVIAVLYVGASIFVLIYHLANESSHASSIQVVSSLLVGGGLIVAAFMLGRRQRPTVERYTPRPRTVFIVSFVAATALNCVPETWIGFGLAVAILIAGVACLARLSRASAWDTRHNVAVAAGALLSRALLAFTYYPVIGNVSAVAKYLHNIVLLATILVVWTLAARAACTK
jgi:hypothetical protein